MIGGAVKAAEPIAVVGLGCRFPGAPDVHAYWRVIREGIDATSEIPASRWDIAEFFDPTGKSPGKMSTRWGGFLDDVDLFDATFFGISPREAAKIDPQQRLLLEVVWEALEYGGFAPDRLRGSATGVFIGIGGVDYSRIPVQLEEYFEQISVHSGTGNALSIAANRISYVLDLRGPSMSIDTACSSSMVATHLAMRSLRSKESDLAIVGGVNLILTPETTIAFSQAQMLSPDGVCRPFDARANGYVRGEGCGILILKRLSDAFSDHDNVLAIVRGSTVNQDGRTSGITAPRGPAQEAVIRKALAESHVAAGDVTYIEAHGTGTPLGDPIEVQTLAKIFGKTAPDELPCYLTSVKANIGHTETASGVASLIKVILMMQHGCIPGQPHLETLNPHIGLEDSRLRIPHENTDWQARNSRVAGVSSFGFGGTNAHVVLEESPQPEPEQVRSAVERPLHVLSNGRQERRSTAAARRAVQRISQPTAARLVAGRVLHGKYGSVEFHPSIGSYRRKSTATTPAVGLHHCKRIAARCATRQVRSQPPAENCIPVYRAGFPVRRHGPWAVRNAAGVPRDTGALR